MNSITYRRMTESELPKAENVYVSATPSESAVGFYKSLGFTLIAEPLPELFALEPEDIHMILKINQSDRN